MLWFILIMVLIIVGASVLVGKMLSGGPRSPDQRERQRDNVNALKLSGALRHRKSNRP